MRVSCTLISHAVQMYRWSPCSLGHITAAALPGSPRSRLPHLWTISNAHLLLKASLQPLQLPHMQSITSLPRHTAKSMWSDENPFNFQFPISCLLTFPSSLVKEGLPELALRLLILGACLTDLSSLETKTIVMHMVKFLPSAKAKL